MLAEGDILTAKDVARLMKISPAMVYRLHSEVKLLARYKVFDGKRGWRWNIHDVEAYLAAVQTCEKCITLPSPRASDVTLVAAVDMGSPVPYVRTKDRKVEKNISKNRPAASPST